MVSFNGNIMDQYLTFLKNYKKMKYLKDNGTLILIECNSKISTYGCLRSSHMKRINVKIDHLQTSYRGQCSSWANCRITFNDD